MDIGHRRLATASGFEPRRRLAVWGLGAVFVALSSLARAQGPCSDLGLGEPSAYRFYVAPGAGSFVQVDSVTIGREFEPSVGVWLDYAHRPFVLDDPDYNTCTSDRPSDRELDVVAGTFTGQISAAIAAADVAQLGLNVPIIAYTWGEGYRWEGGDPRRPFSFPGGRGTAIGDPRLSAKVRFFEQDLGGDAHLGLALVGWIAFPVAREMIPRRYAGEPSLAGGGHLVLGFRWSRLRFAVNLGAAVRADAQLIRSRRTSEMTWGAALAYDVDDMFGALAEVTGQTTFGRVYDDEAPTEARGALFLRVGELTVTLGAGAGVVYAIGVPIVRVFGGAQWEPRPRGDADRDGLTDDVDACPTEREDRDGHADEDGCPDLDDDLDRVPDESDQCPRDPEDRDGNSDDDGCPDRDDDGDGILDGYDSCPAEPEDLDGDRDDDGCPDNDRDRDHLPDEVDACPDAPEDTDGFGDEDGCPEHDFDGDGIPDEGDECPDGAEDVDGFEDTDGCPEAGEAPPRRLRGR